MKKQIANFLEIDEDEIMDLTPEQKKALREYTHNLWQMPSYYTEDAIIFTSESAMKHWQYYAGFEYLDDPETYKRGNNFIAVYSTQNDTDDRIQDYLTVIHETNSETTMES